MRKYWYRKCLIITLVFSVFFYTGYSVKEKMERNEKEEVSAGTVSDNTVIPGGMPIGIYLESWFLEQRRLQEQTVNDWNRQDIW